MFYNSKSIVGFLKKQNLYRAKIKEQDCLRQIRSIFTFTIKENISFMYIRQSTLYFVVTHPVYKQEIVSKLHYLKSLLESNNKFPLCLNYSFNSYHVLLIEPLRKNQIKKIKQFHSHYKEKASQGFEIKSNNPKIKEAFLNIKQSIVKNLKQPTK